MMEWQANPSSLLLADFDDCDAILGNPLTVATCLGGWFDVVVTWCHACMGAFVHEFRVKSLIDDLP